MTAAPPPVLPVAALCFTAARVVAYGSVTDDMNPIHVDADFAARSRFGRPIVHGLFVLAPIWTAIERAFGPAAMTGADATIRFVAPTFVGTTPRYDVVLEGVADGRACYRLHVFGEDGTPAIEGSMTLGIAP